MGKVTVHPTGHVEVDLGPGMQPGAGPVPGMQGAGMHNAHGHPGSTQVSPQPGINDQEGHIPSPTDGAKAALDMAFQQKGAPIQKPDATRGGNENENSKKKAATRPGPPNSKSNKTKTKGDKSAPKGGAPKEDDNGDG